MYVQGRFILKRLREGRNRHVTRSSKLRRKKLDMIVANDAVASIGSDSSALMLITADGKTEQLPPMPKDESARLLVERLARLLSNNAS